MGTEDDVILQSQKHWVDVTVNFFNSIGLVTTYCDEATGFFPGISVRNGTLAVGPDCVVSDLLHEGGHLAVVPAQFRAYLNGNVGSGLHRMLDEIGALDLHPDDLLYRATIQASDPEVQAWGWACGEHLGIPEDLRILDSEFDGEGAVMRQALSMNCHAGINGLAHAGFCLARRVRGLEKPAYPKLSHWIQPVIEPGSVTW
jgi:hypothetical protein